MFIIVLLPQNKILSSPLFIFLNFNNNKLFNKFVTGIVSFCVISVKRTIKNYPIGQLQKMLNKIYYYTMEKIFLIILLLCLFPQNSTAAHFYKEAEYQKSWCEGNNGVMEYKNPDNTRTDCVTDKYAIEFDFAPKWAEMIGQSLYYGIMTGKKPGAVIIVENPKRDVSYLKRAQVLAKKYKVKLWTIGPEDIAPAESISAF